MQLRLIKFLGVGVCVLLLGACDSSRESEQNAVLDEHADPENINASYPVQTDEGRRLTDVAGRTTVPDVKNVEEKSASTVALSKKAQTYVGRYHVVIDCSEKFALCDHGKVDFVNSLLKDGTSHRTLIYMGKMSYDKNKTTSNRVYQQNTWSYNPETHQIEVKRAQGVNFYYDINANGDLVVDLEKVYANNIIEDGQFVDGSYVPTREYVLKKYDVVK